LGILHRDQAFALGRLTVPAAWEAVMVAAIFSIYRPPT
jgi:hypothetical protein